LIKNLGGLYISNKEKTKEGGKESQKKNHKCPYCKTEMKDGEISTTYKMIWKEKVDKEKDRKPDKFAISKPSLTYSRIPAYNCESCKILVVEYDKKKDLKKVIYK
jgi:hypothetical protein